MNNGICRFSASSRVDPAWELSSDQSDLSDREPPSLQDVCADLLLKFIFRLPHFARREGVNASSIRDAPNLVLSRMVSRLPYLSSQEPSDKRACPDAFGVKEAINRFNELSQIDQFAHRFMRSNPCKLKEVFVKALQERYGCLAPFAYIGDPPFQFKFKPERFTPLSLI